MIKTPEQIKMIRNAGKILASVSKKVKEAVKEGVTLRNWIRLPKNS